jgi:polysaccharide pyruvyl transferase WcaK-like protein
LTDRMSRRPRLLIEPSDYVLRNVGDMAMIEAATDRLSNTIPGARLQVLTREPDNLRKLCPDVESLEARGRDLWLALLSPSVSSAIPVRLATKLRLQLERLARPLIRVRRPDLAGRIPKFLDTVRSADALIVTGMGGITDAFPRYASDLLDTMALALAFDVPVFMVGQGIGPLDSRRLRSRAADVLPRVRLIALREGRAGIPALKALGVSPERIFVTGDDAVEMAFEQRSPTLADAIGFNLRVSDYSGVGSQDAQRVADVVRRRGASIIPLPVSRAEEETDIETFHGLFPELTRNVPRIEVAADLIQQTKRCRIVIAGSYHAAVFALSMGVPTIGIAHSPYYVDKFAGLEAMFGEGCAWVDLKEPDAATRLADFIERIWKGAAALRPKLLAAAESQIASGHAAYRKIAAMVSDA